MKNAAVLVLFILSLVGLASALLSRSGESPRIEPASLVPRPEATGRPQAWRVEGRQGNTRFEFGDKMEPLRQLDVGSLERSAKLHVASGEPAY